MAIAAAGGLLWQESAGAPLVAVVHRPRYDDWSLPKGKLKSGEHPLLGGYREVLEETGHHATVQHRLSSQQYRVPEGKKNVDWWVMRSNGGEFTPNHEIDQLRWLPLDEAARILTYDRDRGLLREFGEFGAPTAIVLLVRHGSAGDRIAWVGDDRLRPLDEVGEEQSQRLRRALPLWAPQRVLAADRLRCTQTVEPLAGHLDLPIETEVALSEEAYNADPDTAMRRIRNIAALGGASVVCSQGGAIPSIVAELADVHGVKLAEIKSKKGSTWALSFADGQLIAADYYRDFRSDGAA